MNYVGLTFPIPYYYTVLAESRISDPDGFGEIDSVLLHITGLNDTLMIYNQDSTTPSALYYSITMTEELFPAPFLDSIRYKDFSCSVSDTVGNITLSDIMNIIHVFEPPPPTPLSPENIPLLPATPLVWLLFTNPSAVSFTTRVYHEITTNNWSLTWSKSGIAPSDTTIMITPPLTIDGNYYWEMEAFDIYGNSSRSSKFHFTYFQ
jgi:hypothetical protein